MQTKECGDEGAWPDRASHSSQHQKQEHGIEDVQQDVRQMVPAGAQPEELAVEHVGKPRERMPIVRVVGGERPNDALPVEAGLDMGIGYYVVRIVTMNEFVGYGGPIDCRDGYG